MIHQIVPQIFRRMGRAFAGRNGLRARKTCFFSGLSAFADEMGLRVRRHFFALDAPRVRRRNGSSCAKTLFRAGRAARSQTKWVFVCEDTFSRWTGRAFVD